MFLLSSLCEEPWPPYGFGGGGGACGDPSWTYELLMFDLAISCGKGGLGGGLCVEEGCGDKTPPRCCRDMTGGSFAKTSRSMARKSKTLDFWLRVSLHVYEEGTNYMRGMFHIVKLKYSHPKTQPTLPGMDGRPCPEDQHAARPSPSFPPLA